jgi:uncharacterized protein (DUF305 family)
METEAVEGILTARTRRAAALLLVLAGTAGAGRIEAQETQPTEKAQGSPTASPAAMSPAEYEALFRARRDSAGMRFTDADASFMTRMIAHHAQALVMAELAPVNGASPAVQTLCARILNAQRDEIETMQRWLRDRGRPVPEVRIDGLDLTIVTPMPDGTVHREEHPYMHGMLTQDEIERLAAARGPEFDRLFLSGMIRHHQGAVDMVDHLFSMGGSGQEETVFKIANDIHADQLTEIARMQRMLDRIDSMEETQ